MTSTPTQILKQNSYRIVLDQPDLTADFERLEDLAANAIAAARTALQAVENLPYEAFKPIQQAVADLTKAIDKRRVLNDDFRLAAEMALRTLARLDCVETDAATFDPVQRNLRDALNLSHRVADLLAAERDVGWIRGLGR